MHLVLEIVNHPPFDILQKNIQFDNRGGKIGRSKKAKWTLNDPTRKISNFHAEIRHKNGQFYITDISTNGMFVKNPHKKFIKGSPMLLDEKMVIEIGDYAIAVKTLDSAFIQDSLSSQESKQNNNSIPDTFFKENEKMGAFGVIQEKTPQSNDIISLIDNNPSSSNEEGLLPDLNEILGLHREQEEVFPSGETLSTHITPPTFSYIEESEPQSSATVAASSSEIAKLFSLKLGIDIDKLSTQEQTQFVSQLTDLVSVSLEHLQQTYRTVQKVRTALDIPIGDMHTSLLSTSDISKVLLSKQPLIGEVKSLFKEIDAHTIAFHTSFKNISERTAEKFSPEKLYLDFEHQGALNKSFTNKKALAWEAYCEKYKDLNDSSSGDGTALKELKKEYKSVLDIINLGYNN